MKKMILVFVNVLFLFDSPTAQQRNYDVTNFSSSAYSIATTVKAITIYDGQYIGGNPFDTKDCDEFVKYSDYWCIKSSEKAAKRMMLQTSPSYIELAENQVVDTANNYSPLAETYLERLAKQSKFSRQATGVFWMLAGIAVMGYGISSVSKEEIENYEKGFVFAYGTYAFIFGLYKLTAGTKAELMNTRTKQITHLRQKEIFARESLISLARKARSNRLSTAGMFAGASLYFFAAQPIGKSKFTLERGLYREKSDLNYAWGATCAMASLYFFAINSKEERALDDYYKAMEEQSTLMMRLGISPNGSALIEFVHLF